MTAQQFDEMNVLDQVSAIMQFGRLMAQNTEDDRLVFLYRLESFYVSACYTRPDDKLTEISSFLEVNQLIPHFRKQLISIHPAERDPEGPCA